MSGPRRPVAAVSGRDFRVAASLLYHRTAKYLAMLSRSNKRAVLLAVARQIPFDFSVRSGHYRALYPDLAARLRPWSKAICG